jgi:hypothetical protein
MTANIFTTIYCLQKVISRNNRLAVMIRGLRRINNGLGGQLSRSLATKETTQALSQNATVSFRHVQQTEVELELRHTYATNMR